MLLPRACFAGLALVTCRASAQDVFLASSSADEGGSAERRGRASAVSLEFAGTSGDYSLSVDGQAWFASAGPPVVCIAGRPTPLHLQSVGTSSGADAFGSWKGQTATFTSDSPSANVQVTFKTYVALPQLVVGTATFPAGLDTSNCGAFASLSTAFPSFSLHANKAPELNTLSWRGGVMSKTVAARGLEALAANGIDCGPVVSTDTNSPQSTSLVWSTLDHHKIVPQRTSNGSYAMGMSAAIPKLPAGFEYSVMFSVARGGMTAGMYAWGALIQSYHGISRSKRLPAITLSDIGYYTDDGAYYYVWGGAKEKGDPELSPWIPPRPWPAEEGLVLVKEALWASGVPVAYMQLDDWWYQGPFYMGNVKAVVDWNASNSSGLFPHGLPAFSDKLGLPLQLYTPWWSYDFKTKYRTFNSTKFGGTKLVVPDDSYHFFADLFDFGKKITNGRFNTYEIDFLHDNFEGCAACFDDVGAADRWYGGMADAAKERNITIQYCLASATDMLLSLSYPAVVQARASSDYVDSVDNVAQLGGSSLLLGATAMAPSKDTLWTASPQPATSSDTIHQGYTDQPHVELDVVLAVLSLGPVGISDGLNQTDVALISQTFRNQRDSTLLRPSRPLSTVDSVFANTSRLSVLRLPARRLERQESLVATGAEESVKTPVFDDEQDGDVADVRSTHASLGESKGPLSHYVVAWRSTQEVTLQPTDLYPAPSASSRLAIRRNFVKQGGAPGCLDGKAAAPDCVDILEAGQRPRLPAVTNSSDDAASFGLWSIYEPASNGAYFLGELSKVVHVSPQRFDHVLVQDATAAAPCGLTIRVKGSPGETVSLTAVDPNGVVHIAAITVAVAGFIDVSM